MLEPAAMSEPNSIAPRLRRGFPTRRYYRIALGVSLLVNALLLTGVYYYNSIEGVLSTVEMAVGIID